MWRKFSESAEKTSAISRERISTVKCFGSLIPLLVREKGMLVMTVNSKRMS